MELNKQPNDPSGDLLIEGLRVEVKHPNTTNQLEKLARSFNGELKRLGMHGVFVVGLEDAFQLNERKMFTSSEDAQAWLSSKRQEMEAYGPALIETAARLPNILALAQVASFPLAIQGRLAIHREGNSLLFDDRSTPTKQEYEGAQKISAAFNPQPQLYTNIKKALLSRGDKDNPNPPN